MSDGTKATAKEIVKILNEESSKKRGEEFKANFTGAWDKFNVFQAEVVSINRGNGFEDAVKVTGVEYECFIYMPPFKIENLPTKAMMFTFYADNGLYIKSK